MKTPEQILDEVAAENMINIQQMVTTKQLAILAMRRYAQLYHQAEVKKLGLPVVSGSLLDWQKIEDEVYDMYKLPVSVNVKGLKFKFYAEFLSGASWMRKRILGNDR